MDKTTIEKKSILFWFDVLGFTFTVKDLAVTLKC